MQRPVFRGGGRLVEDYRGFQQRIREMLPRALFVLVPVLALVLAMFYRRRHYPEHLYTALHLQTFVFLTFAFESIFEYTRSASVLGTAYVVAVLFIVAHAIAAQRRIYGESTANHGSRLSSKAWPSQPFTECCGARPRSPSR